MPSTAMVETSPARFRRDREPKTRWLPAHQKRAGLGVWTAGRSRQSRCAIKSWKRSAPFDPVGLDVFARATVDVILAWSPVLPSGTVVTVPPQGASAPGPYAAEALGEFVAASLGLPFVRMLARTEPKRWHGPHSSLRQPAYVFAMPESAPTIVLVVDDLITTGRTMRLSLEAIRGGGVAAFGFGFSGV
jgi:Phosphoribosyl transferase domain